MTICLVDFSQLVISSVAADPAELKGGDIKNFVKHVALVQLLALKKKFKGKLILCVDSRNGYWRTDEFEYYKGHRKHKKDKDFLDWDLIRSTIDELKDELRENFPYMVLELKGAEADDIIATLAEYFATNELNTAGLSEVPEEVVICSTDGDFQQLQKFKHVKQWNNVTKQMIVCNNPKQFLIEHIVTGDDGDNIPNICTGNDWAKCRADNVKTRAKSFMKARLPDFYSNGIDACENEKEKNNYRRNELLVDLSQIPKDIYDGVISLYTNYTIQGNKNKIFAYLNAHRMKLLLADYQNF